MFRAGKLHAQMFQADKNTACSVQWEQRKWGDAQRKSGHSEAWFREWRALSLSFYSWPSRASKHEHSMVSSAF